MPTRDEPRRPRGANAPAPARAPASPKGRGGRAPKKRAAAKAPPSEQPRAGTIGIVGRPNVGKSTLLNALLGERLAITSHHPQTTRDRIAGIAMRGSTQLVFLDTPGVHNAKNKLGARMNELARSTASECDVAVMMTEVEVRGGEVQATFREDDRAILATIPAGKPTILVVNKIDRVQPKARLFPVLEAFAAERDFAAVVPISALKGDGPERVIEAVAALLPEGEPLYDPEEMSDKPIRFFVSEFVREQVLRRTRQEVPHGVAVTVESFDDGARLARIAVTVHVAKESHKGIIIGDGGAMLREIGSAARRRVEALLGRKVHLETFVRATPRWFDDDARLVDMGYGAETKPPRTPRSR